MHSNSVSHFRPFYRIEQLIIKPKYNVPYYDIWHQQNFGAFLNLTVLDEVMLFIRFHWSNDVIDINLYFLLVTIVPDHVEHKYCTICSLLLL